MGSKSFFQLSGAEIAAAAGILRRHSLHRYKMQAHFLAMQAERGFKYAMLLPAVISVVR